MKKITLFFGVLLICCAAFAQEPTTLVSVYPADGATNVSPFISDAIVATFNQDVVLADVSKITINGTPLTQERVEVEKTVIILIADYFTPATLYEAVIDVGAIEGLTTEVRWSFTSADIAINLTVTPENGATNVNAGAAIEFKKQQDASGNMNYYDLYMTDVFVDGNPLSNTKIDRYDFSTYRVSHRPLAYNTLHTVIIPVFGTDYDTDYGHGYSWSFTTEPAPEKLRVIPADGAEGVTLNANIQVQFDKTILEGSEKLSSISVKDEAGNEAPTTKSVAGSVLFIYHTGYYLAGNTKYTVTVPAGAVHGIEAFSYSFTTVGGSGIGDVNADNAVVVYPSKGSITVVTPSPAKISIADISGKQLATYQSNGNITIPVNYANGLYIVRVNTNGSISSHKVIVK
ncbi:Ig-like domain-containing protein [Viscerimonas tarda]